MESLNQGISDVVQITSCPLYRVVENLIQDFSSTTGIDIQESSLSVGWRVLSLDKSEINRLTRSDKVVRSKSAEVSVRPK